MTYEQKQIWQKFREKKRPYIENDEYRMICEMYAEVFSKKLVYVCKCNPNKIQDMIDKLNDKYNAIG